MRFDVDRIFISAYSLFHALESREEMEELRKKSQLHKEGIIAQSMHH